MNHAYIPAFTLEPLKREVERNEPVAVRTPRFIDDVAAGRWSARPASGFTDRATGEQPDRMVGPAAHPVDQIARVRQPVSHVHGSVDDRRAEAFEGVDLGRPGYLDGDMPARPRISDARRDLRGRTMSGCRADQDSHHCEPTVAASAAASARNLMPRRHLRIIGKSPISINIIDSGTADHVAVHVDGDGFDDLDIRTDAMSYGWRPLART